tara:strand:+ start:1628 stop:2113 length:486 start_codon:yes stop_codon:yes gene_type:complete
MLGQIKLALFFIMILGAGGGLWYVQHLKSENEILTLNNAKLEESVEGQKAVIQQQLQDIEQIQSISKDLQEKNARLTADLNVANEKFNKINASGDRRDMGDLALNRPKSVERIERKREKQKARCFEIAQGSPLTEEELNATKKSQTNAECPNIANPNYVPY